MAITPTLATTALTTHAASKSANKLEVVQDLKTVLRLVGESTCPSGRYFAFFFLCPMHNDDNSLSIQRYVRAEPSIRTGASFGA